MSASAIETFDQLYLSFKSGDAEAFHKIEQGAITENDDAAATYLYILYMQGSDHMLCPNHTRANNLITRVKNYLSGVEEKISDPDTTPASRENDIYLFLLGFFYREGWGFSTDNAKAVRYFERSAANEYPPSLNMLGNLYYNGWCGLSVDNTKSFKYYTDASEKLGYFSAHFNMGLSYQYGKGATKSEDKAYEYFEKAARTGLPIAVRFMSEWYKDKKKDMVKAKEFLRMEVAQGSDKAMLTLATLLESETAEADAAECVDVLNRLDSFSSQASLLHEDVKRRSDPSIQWRGTLMLAKRYAEKKPGVVPDDTKCFELFQKLSSAGDALLTSEMRKECNYFMGMAYLEGKGVTVNVDEAIKYFDKAHQLGSPEAKYQLGMLYLEGTLVTQDIKMAFNRFKESAEKAYRDAVFMYGSCLLEQPEFANEALGYEQMRIAATMGHIRAQYMLGFARLQGLGEISRSTTEAFSWFLKAANAGDSDAMYNLGMMYLQGSGVEADRDSSIMWFEKGAESGDTDAMYNAALTLLRISLSREDIDEEEEAENRKLVTVEEELRAKAWLQKAMELGDEDAQLKFNELFP